jgi:cell division protein FtsB
MNAIVHKAISRLRDIMSPIRLVVLLAVISLFWFLILGDDGIGQFRQLLEMKQRLTAERTAINTEIDRLTRERAMLKDPRNLEMIIRSELGYVRPGEILFEEKLPEKQ